MLRGLWQTVTMKHETKIRTLKQWTKSIQHLNVEISARRAAYHKGIQQLRSMNESADGYEQLRHYLTGLLVEGINPLPLPTTSSLKPGASLLETGYYPNERIGA